MDNKLLFAKTEDLFDLCDKRASAQFSSFLDGGECAEIEDNFKIPYGYNTMMYGGYDGAERKIFAVFPQWEEGDKEKFPISVIRFDVPSFRKLTHRDYLGTVMSLGIDRSKLGDILVDDSGAYIIAEEDISEYIAVNITKIANMGVKSRIVKVEDFTPPKPKVKEKPCVAASLRLDAVISAALGISRNISEKLVKEDKVKVNHRAVSNRSIQLNEGDMVSVRGYGRFVLCEAGKETQKGRIHIIVEQYI